MTVEWVLIVVLLLSAVAIVWARDVPAPSPMDALSGAKVDAIFGMWADVLLSVVPDTGSVGVLIAVNVDIFSAVVSALRCVTPPPVEAPSC